LSDFVNAGDLASDDHDDLFLFRRLRREVVQRARFVFVREVHADPSLAIFRVDAFARLADGRPLTSSAPPSASLRMSHDSAEVAVTGAFSVASVFRHAAVVDASSNTTASTRRHAVIFVARQLRTRRGGARMRASNL
jgi:hypothetical protein